jgi:hypothetical protein
MSRRECKDASQDTKLAISEYYERFITSAVDSGIFYYYININVTSGYAFITGCNIF